MPQEAVSVSDDCILVSGEQVAANLQVTLAPGCLSMTAGSDQNCFVSVWIWSTLIYVIDQSVKWTRTGCLWMTVGSDLDYSVWDKGLRYHWAIYIVQYTSIAPIHPRMPFNNRCLWSDLNYIQFSRPSIIDLTTAWLFELAPSRNLYSHVFPWL